ncbi:DUF202 domain-containing protein [Demequina sp. SYSU T00192]|uniref:DUF202 domain-containing protein n=1 Tax=Demequina litoralis TaxID=3051660 RepID=A0ABT8G6U5_9MICO|nr:DUF202 domain-containing protein [Demequina sp. SYSU T00192]MDN4474869.1 DUF202 domain-containing protein [Demequina sp. SYSU T00192]
MADSPGFPRRVYGVGDAPDARFSLANERTYLAWTRTALALFAAGVGLEALDAPVHPTLRLIVAVLFSGLGIVAGVSGLVGWLRAERALRLGTPLPGPRVGILVTVGVVVGMVLVVVGMLV